MRWRAVELDRARTEGPVFPSGPSELASVDGWRIVARDTEAVVLDAAGTLVWRHECGARPRAALVSADRVMVLTNSLDYNAWGCLGPALLLDLVTGTRLAELRGERAAAQEGGRFLLGLEGYDTFGTWLHDRDGRLLTTWHSYGHYVVDADGTRVVECDRNRPTRSAVVRLLPNGLIERGHRLRDGQVAAPVVLPDGTIVVLDCGVLLAVGPDLRGTVLADVLEVSDEDAWRLSTTLDWRAEDGTLAVTVQERTREVPITYTTHHVHYALRS